MERSEDFGIELRRRREAAGVSLGQFAEMAHYSKGHLSKIENGLKKPSREMAVRFDALLSAGNALARLVPPQDGPDATAPPHPARQDRSWVIELNADGQARVIAMNTPGFGLLPTPVAVMRLHGSHPTALEPTKAAHADMLTAIRRVGQTVGPRGLLLSIVPQIHALKALAQATRRGERDGFLLLTAHYAEYAGWLAQESGEREMAEEFTLDAAALAEESGDKDIPAYALIRLALIRLYEDDGKGVIDLAEHALTHRSVSPRVRGLALQRLAQGHALTGDLSNCLKNLDAAAGLLGDVERADGEPARPTLGSMHVINPVEAALGWCFYDLGRPRQAAEHLTRTMAGLPLNAQRSRARYGARYALSLYAMGEVTQACETASEVLDLATAVDSATIRTDLRRLRRGLSRWRGHSPVRELLPRLDRLSRGAERV